MTGEAEPGGEYAFGDTPRAAERLARVAKVFGPSSRAFLETAPLAAVADAIDLGCGPGFTSELLRRHLPRARITGLDDSEAFLALARDRNPEGVEYLAHDVGRVPLPNAPVDLLYCRFLLTHLADPLDVLARWATQLRPGGRLLLEEAEWIRSEVDAFRHYLSIVEALLAHRGHCLFVGPRLAAADVAGLRVLESGVRELSVAPMEAARLFSLNLEVWRRDPFVVSRVGEARIESLARELAERALDSDEGAEIRWGLRQIVFEG